jgi:hypothetical protein
MVIITVTLCLSSNQGSVLVSAQDGFCGEGTDYGRGAD